MFAFSRKYVYCTLMRRIARDAWHLLGGFSLTVTEALDSFSLLDIATNMPNIPICWIEIYMQHISLLDRYEFHNIKGISMWRSCYQLSGVKDRHLLIQDYLKFMLFFELQVLCNPLSCQSCTGKGLKTKVKKQRKFKLCRKITSNYWVKVF